MSDTKPLDKAALRQDLREVLSKYLVGDEKKPTNVVAEYFINVITALNTGKIPSSVSVPENVATTN